MVCSVVFTDLMLIWLDLTTQITGYMNKVQQRKYELSMWVVNGLVRHLIVLPDIRLAGKGDKEVQAAMKPFVSRAAIKDKRRRQRIQARAARDRARSSKRRRVLEPRVLNVGGSSDEEEMDGTDSSSTEDSEGNVTGDFSDDEGTGTEDEVAAGDGSGVSSDETGAENEDCDDSDDGQVEQGTQDGAENRGGGDCTSSRADGEGVNPVIDLTAMEQRHPVPDEESASDHDEDEDIPDFTVIVNNATQAELVRDNISFGLSFRQTARSLCNTKDKVGVGQIGHLTRQRVSEHARIACAVSLEAIRSILSMKWGFSIALDVGSLHKKKTWCVFRIRLHHDGQLENLHLISVPMNTGKTANQIMNVSTIVSLSLGGRYSQ